MDNYFRVRVPDKVWTDPGPDLLRPAANARRQIASLIKEPNGWQVRRQRKDGTYSDWSRSLKKSEALNKFDLWRPDGPEVMHFAWRRGSETVVRVIVRKEEIKYLRQGNTSNRVNVINSLINHQFPDTTFSGGFVCKNSAPGYTSDHAWKDALDRTEGNSTTNDELFDWSVRMSTNGCWEVDQILGSRKGQVANSETPSYEINAGGADNTHMWHCHYSVVNHHGADSPFC